MRWRELGKQLLETIRQIAQESLKTNPFSQAAFVGGMGAIPHDNGVAFRVWAPHAEAVYVAGSFNAFHGESHPMVQEGNGYWSLEVPEANIGDQYKYRIISAGNQIWRNDPYAREVTNSVGNSVVHDPHFDWETDDYSTPAWNEMVIYEMHIGTARMQANGGRGTFDSAIEMLPYLQDLGINTLLVMPPMEFAGDQSWGYNPAHPFAVESSYGGPQAFKRFVKAAHQHGLAVLLDVVYNHFGPSDLDLWQFDGWSENGKGGIYFYNDGRSTTPWGDTRPDYGRQEVRQYIRDNVLMWLEEYHVDGLRFDATAYIRNVHGGEDEYNNLADGWNVMRWINDEIDARQPWKITIAEDLRNNPALTSPTSEGGAGFDAQWDSEFVHPVREAVIRMDDANRDVDAVGRAISHRYNNDAFKRVIYTESHDEVANGKARVPQEIDPNDVDGFYAKKRSTLGAALVLTAPGIPMLFQGQEFLEDGWFDDQRALDWDKLKRNAGIHRLYRDLMRLRRNYQNNTRGLSGQYVDVFHRNQDDKVLAFQRWNEGGPNDSVIVVANLAYTTHAEYWMDFPLAGHWAVRLNSDWVGYDENFTDMEAFDVHATAAGDGQPARAAIKLGPYAVVILSYVG